MDSIADLQTLGQYFFHTPDYHSEAAQQFRARIKLDGNAYALMLGRMREDLKAMRDGVSVQALAEWMERAPTRYDLKPGQFKMALRFALTGQAVRFEGYYRVICVNA